MDRGNKSSKISKVLQCNKTWPRGLTDKASDFESEDCEFESRRGRPFLEKLGEVKFYVKTIELLAHVLFQPTI